MSVKQMELGLTSPMISVIRNKGRLSFAGSTKAFAVCRTSPCQNSSPSLESAGCSPARALPLSYDLKVVISDDDVWYLSKVNYFGGGGASSSDSVSDEGGEDLARLLGVGCGDTVSGRSRFKRSRRACSNFARSDKKED
jgi:hypothetical protein